jgi:hypothetical protein
MAICGGTLLVAVSEPLPVVQGGLTLYYVYRKK